MKLFRTDDVGAFHGLHIQTDADIEKIVKQSFQTILHATSTYAMGMSTDKMAVVDNQARVYGLSGRRVVDASAFPFVPPGHPASTVSDHFTNAFAEKVADAITAYWWDSDSISAQ